MPSILIVDDHPPARHLRMRLLRNAGFDTEECDTARGVLDRVLSRGSLPDLVLLDVGLPDGNGYDVCERVKAAHPALPVALISAVYCTADARRNGMRMGADAYLLEPLEAGQLVDAVQKLTSPDRDGASDPAVFRTTPDGGIIWLNDAAAALLNMSARGAYGRRLLTFFNGGRAQLETELARARAGQVCGFTASFRPRERRPLDVRVDLASPADGASNELEWIVEPVKSKG